MRKKPERHGMSGSPEYTVWAGMIQRCTNPKSAAWKDYGGRGIKVCMAWRRSFARFYADMGPRPSLDMTIERKDNDKGYNPKNCEWAPASHQNWNKRGWGKKARTPLQKLKQSELEHVALLSGTTAGALRHVQAGRRMMSSEMAIRIERAASHIGLHLPREGLNKGCKVCEFAKACRKAAK